MISAEAIGIAIVGALSTIVAWLAKHRIEKLEQDVNALGKKVQDNREEVLKDYIHEDRFTQRMESALGPINATLARIERSMDSIFDKLDGKADRRDGHAG